MKKFLSIIFTCLAMVSCVDTVLLPNDKTVEEDFWQTKNDVQMMMNGAYASLATSDLQQRFVIWTMRSDELNVNSALNNSNLNQIHSANMQTTNGYANWNNLYYVINNCNLVIDKSESVMSIDPNYLMGDHLSAVGQMKALRALCYFYLVRVFRDVPLILEPYKESSAEMNVPQVAPVTVVDQIIADLEEVKDNLLSSQAVTDWQRVGYFTRDAAYALLADVYLWKASVLGDEASYDNCIRCCDVIRRNRANDPKNQFGSMMSNLDDDGYSLNQYYSYYNPFQVGNNSAGNDQESLLELQFTNNEGLCNVYFKKENKATAQPMFYTSEVYSVIAADDNHVFNHANYVNDVRGFESVFGFNGAAEDGFFIRKMVAQSGSTFQNQAPEASIRTGNERAYGAYDQNWIFYRVTDVMLMKAEALVEKARMRAVANASLAESLANATNDADKQSLASQLYTVNKEIAGYFVTAVRQAQITSTRARKDELSEIDSTKYVFNTAEFDAATMVLNDYANGLVNTFKGFETTAKDLEILIMNERARELCFEGKRWFDMLRYNYRHVEGVNYSTILAEQGGNFVKNYDEMLKLIARKYTSGGGSGITSKMLTEPYLYMPIQQAEVDVNPLLKQNPVYTDGGTTEKNY